MLDWLFQSEYNAPVTAAVWSTVACLAATVVLFAYTVVLRVANVIGSRRRADLVARWRSVIAAAALSPEDAETMPLPYFSRVQRTDLLAEWNRACDTVEGSAADNLVTLAGRLKIPEIAKEMFARRRLKAKLLAVQTLGHLRDKDSWAAIEEFLTDNNTALSITAAIALVDIDAARAVLHVVPMITKRRDWPRTRVCRFLRMAGSSLVSEPLIDSIRTSRPEEMVYLLQFVQLAESDVIDALAEDLIRSSKDPVVLTAALRLVSGHAGVPRIGALAHHDAWFVRMQAAKVLGRVGQQEHLSMLESMLEDKEWWVRYRAAQSITSLPFLGPNALRRIHARQTDRYARDMLKQALAEVGLA